MNLNVPGIQYQRPHRALVFCYDNIVHDPPTFCNTFMADPISKNKCHGDLSERTDAAPDGARMVLVSNNCPATLA